MKFDRECDLCHKIYLAQDRYIKRGQGRFCSLSCSSRAPRNRRTTKTLIKCSWCGTEVFKTQSQITASKSGLLFCSRICKEKAQSLSGGMKEIQPPHYGINSATIDYRSLAFQIYDHKCRVCGWNTVIEVLEVNHIDCDRSNNSIENLEILCPTCHALFHFNTKTGYWKKKK